MGVNLPTTNPLWTDQRVLDGLELTPEEQQISEKQFEVLQKTLNTLNQPVREGDTKAAQARVNSLKQHFESLSPDMKEYMYSVLQTNMGRKDLSEVFHGKLSSASRDELLKVLNPNHKTDQIKTETIDDAKAKASKASERANKAYEKALEGLVQERQLLEFMKAYTDNVGKPMTAEDWEKLEKGLKPSTP